ncbi:unnamed protein product [Toxocara canis]|uniref:Neuropeptide n=1 Tax=Toxocara canis TaxID=6265 RepID=A0A183URN8_TOXCA|nr:unnamed protein product [Toxocara canis]
MCSRAIVQFAVLVLSASVCSPLPICIHGNLSSGDYPCSDFDRFMPPLPLTDYRKMLELLMNRRSVFGEPSVRSYSHPANGDISLRRAIQTILMKKPSSGDSINYV